MTPVGFDWAALKTNHLKRAISSTHVGPSAIRLRNRPLVRLGEFDGRGLLDLSTASPVCGICSSRRGLLPLTGPLPPALGASIFEPGFVAGLTVPITAHYGSLASRARCPSSRR